MSDQFSIHHSKHSAFSYLFPTFSQSPHSRISSDLKKTAKSAKPSSGESLPAPNQSSKHVNKWTYYLSSIISESILNFALIYLIRFYFEHSKISLYHVFITSQTLVFSYLWSSYLPALFFDSKDSFRTFKMFFMVYAMVLIVGFCFFISALYQYLGSFSILFSPFTILIFELNFDSFGFERFACYFCD